MPRLALVLLAVACGTPEPATPDPAPAAAPEPAPAPAPVTSVTLAATTGDVVVTPVYHATVRVQSGPTVVWIDPWTKAPLPSAPEADIVLLTDVHPDHLDAAAITAVAKPGAVVVGPRAVADELHDVVTKVLANGEATEVAGVRITAEPMYNLVRGPETGGVFHEKGRGNGYLLAVGGKTIYVAGDTECTPEMKALTGIDLALIPMNLPYTMPPDEAAECVKAFRPAQVVPYHYGDSDLGVFTSALAGVDGVTVTTIDVYPGGLPF